MNFILLFLFSSLTFALDGTFSEFFRFLTRPDGTTQLLECPDTSDAPHCADLAAAICARKRGSARFQLKNNLQQRLGDRSYDARRSVIRAAQQEALNRAPVRWEDISYHYVSIRTNLQRMVNEQTNLPADVRSRMSSRMSSTRLIDSEGFFNEGASKGKSQNDLMTMYVNRCGETGLNESMFMVDDSIVVCPGALMQGIDNGALSSDDFLNSLTFMIAHEAAHPISSEKFPEIYQNMAACFNSVSRSSSYWQQKGEELSTDYWATRILAQRLAVTGVTNNFAATAIFQNFGNRCGQELSSSFPSTTDRLNLVVGRNPVMREVLGCLAPTEEKPVCGLLGKQP